MLPSRQRVVSAEPFDQIILDFHCRILCNWRNWAPMIGTTIADRLGRCLLHIDHRVDSRAIWLAF
jgi:hypothetical protein